MNDRPATSTLVDAPLQPRTRSSHATDAGQARYRQIRTAIDEITARLYGDLPADDLATAGRVLSVITARANTELAGTVANLSAGNITGQNPRRTS